MVFAPSPAPPGRPRAEQYLSRLHAGCSRSQGGQRAPVIEQFVSLPPWEFVCHSCSWIRLVPMQPNGGRATPPTSKASPRSKGGDGHKSRPYATTEGE